jgi:hypothetical protein
MSRRNSKLLVIDASIAKGSGDRRYNPIGSSPGDLSRKCLVAVREEKHIAVFSCLLRREWRNHASLYSTEWLKAMERKNLTADNEGEEFSGLLDGARQSLASENHRAALAKDFHLVKSALATGQTILSNERKLPTLVATVCRTITEFTALYYANPAVEEDACILWIKAGAEKDAERRIDVWAESHRGSD